MSTGGVNPPQPPRPAALRIFGSALGAALLLAGLAATGAWLLFSNLALYDDEGYVLISARDYFVHGHLYESVYSQYGPSFYVMTDMFQHLLGTTVNNTSARCLTLGFWLGTAACCAALVSRQTASRGLTVLTLATTFLYLYFITDEPFHPGSLVIFVLSLSLLVTTELLARSRLRAFVAAAGTTGAVLFLAKINVGVFYLVAVGAWALLHAASAPAHRVARSVATTALAVLAVALMHTLWHERWIHVYLALFVAGSIALVSVLDRAPLFRGRHATLFVAVAIGVGLLILGAVWLRGTSVAGLIEGVLFGPLRHPGNYSYPVDWRPGSLLAAAASLALALPWLRLRFSSAGIDRLIVIVRLVLAAGLLVAFVLLTHARVIGAVFSYVAPLIWLWIVPLGGVRLPAGVRPARGLLACVLLVQYLHAYPTGGSQESWATFLFWPLAALGLGEILLWTALPENSAWRLPRWRPALAAAALLLVVVKVGWTARAAHGRYATRTDLALPGAGHIRLPESLRTAYPLLALNAVVHADQLFSLPGMFSFNLWTGLPTPTLKNTTLWFTLLNEADQAAIIRSIEATPRTCIVVQETLVELMTALGVPMRGPLHAYLKANFAPAFRVEGFSFLVRRGRTVAPLGLARLGSARGGLETRVELCLVGDDTAVERIEIRDVTAPAGAPPAQVLEAANTRVFAVAINRADQAAGAPVAAAWPLRLKGLTRVSLQFDRAGVNLNPASTAFYLIGPAGKIIGHARVGE